MQLFPPLFVASRTDYPSHRDVLAALETPSSKLAHEMGMARHLTGQSLQMTDDDVSVETTQGERLLEADPFAIGVAPDEIARHTPPITEQVWVVRHNDLQLFRPLWSAPEIVPWFVEHVTLELYDRDRVPSPATALEFLDSNEPDIQFRGENYFKTIEQAPSEEYYALRETYMDMAKLAVLALEDPDHHLTNSSQTVMGSEWLTVGTFHSGSAIHQIDHGRILLQHVPLLDSTEESTSADLPPEYEGPTDEFETSLLHFSTSAEREGLEKGDGRFHTALIHTFDDWLHENGYEGLLRHEFTPSDIRSFLDTIATDR
jgi:hypothetical protein